MMNKVLGVLGACLIIFLAEVSSPSLPVMLVSMADDQIVKGHLGADPKLSGLFVHQIPSCPSGSLVEMSLCTREYIVDGALLGGHTR